MSPDATKAEEEDHFQLVFVQSALEGDSLVVANQGSQVGAVEVR